MLEGAPERSKHRAATHTPRSSPEAHGTPALVRTFESTMPPTTAANPHAGNPHNLFRQKSHNSQIETLLDEISAYNPALAGEDDAMLWDIPEFSGEMGELNGEAAATVRDGSGPWKIGRNASVGMISRTMSAGNQQQPAAQPSVNAPKDGKQSKQAWPGNVGPCAVCGLVAAEISCHECRQNTCAFCDFQVHKNMGVSHTARVSLRPAAAQGKPEWSATMALTNKNGKRPQESRPQPQMQQHLGRTMSAELMGGASLDDAILDFFKTDEFTDAVTKADLDGLPEGFPSANEDVDMFGSSDFTGLPLMDMQRPTKMARTSTRVRMVQTKPKVKTEEKAPRPSVAKARPATAKPAAAAHPPAPTVALEAKPRPLNFKFQLDPTAATASTFRATRQAALKRFHRKREQQKLNPTVRYKSRKKIADNRPRIKGRFVKTENLVRAT